MADEDEEGNDSEVETDAPVADVASAPNDSANPREVVERKIPQDIRDKYEVISYRNAAVILAEARASEFGELLDALRSFAVTTEMIRKSGGNESEMPKVLSNKLRPLGWHETIIGADLTVTLSWREKVAAPRSLIKGLEPRMKSVSRERVITREKYLDGHKIDYVKGKVAFDMEWNSKDQTFDRDLYAMNAFFL